MLPIARKGNLATLLEYDFNEQSVFLIDASIFLGSSGSPVFILRESRVPFPTNITNTRVYFLGIISASMMKNEYNQLKIVQIPTTNNYAICSQTTLNLGVVIKAEKLLETINLFYQSSFNQYIAV